MHDATLAKYMELDLYDYWKDAREQFYHWIMMMSWMGTHVPTDAIENTAICWRDYVVDIKTGVARRFSNRPDEKNHSYYLFINEESFSNWDAFIGLHKLIVSYHKDG